MWDDRGTGRPTAAHPVHRKDMWINAALEVLKRVDDAVKWYRECTPDQLPTWRHLNLSIGDRSWLTEVRCLLRRVDPTDPTRQLPEGEARDKLVAHLRGAHKAAAHVTHLHRVHHALDQVRSLTEVRELIEPVTPPPFTRTQRSRANHLRVLARGGIRGLLGWSGYEAACEVTSSGERVPGSAKCPLCGEGLTVEHLIRDCVSLEDTRRRCWGEARGVCEEEAQRTGVRVGMAEVPPPGVYMDPLERHQWWLLTVGAAVDDGFGTFGLGGWHHRGWPAGSATPTASTGIPLVARTPTSKPTAGPTNWATYAAVLHCTGQLLEEAVRRCDEAQGRGGQHTGPRHLRNRVVPAGDSAGRVLVRR